MFARVEVNLFFLCAVNMAGKPRNFGGLDHGDDQATLVNPGKKSLTDIVQDDSFREFEFRQYLFACQAKVCKNINLCVYTTTNIVCFFFPESQCQLMFNIELTVGP